MTNKLSLSAPNMRRSGNYASTNRAAARSTDIWPTGSAPALWNQPTTFSRTPASTPLFSAQTARFTSKPPTSSTRTTSSTSAPTSKASSLSFPTSRLQRFHPSNASVSSNAPCPIPKTLTAANGATHALSSLKI